jgi:hypothetical protein
MDDWEIKKPLGQCSGTGRAIVAGEEYFAALVETPQGLERRDFCSEYWSEHKPEVFCYWKSKLVPPEQKKKLFVDDDMLMAFFERLANETEQEKINFRFVLMLILMRKRLLKYDSSRITDGKEMWRLRITGTDTMADVVNPHLSEEQIEQLSSQVGQILQVEGL